MKKSLLFSSTVALAMLINNSAYANFSLYICNLSKRTIHFKETYHYQAYTDDDYSRDFVVAPKKCGHTINFTGDTRGFSRLDDQIQWTMTDINTGENLGEIDFHGNDNSNYMRFGIGSAQLKFVDYPKDSIILYHNNYILDHQYYRVNPLVANTELPFSHRTTNWFEHVYSEDVHNIQRKILQFKFANSSDRSGTIQITDGIPESSKTYEDFRLNMYNN